jgi:hypothetical protein
MTYLLGWVANDQPFLCPGPRMLSVSNSFETDDRPPRR